MATFDINAVARRAQYTSTGTTGPHSFSFQVNATSELKVYVNDVVKTETTDYTVSLNADGTGSITFGSATTTDDIITIIGDLPLSRSTAYPTGQPITSASLNTDFDNLYIISQQLAEITNRSIQLKPSTGRTVTGAEFSTTGPLYFPELSADKVISVNSAGTGLEATNTLTDISTLAAKATEIGLLGTADAIADMAILGTADVVTDMNVLATADVVADMNTLASADFVSDLNTLATSAIVTDMNLLATSANVTAMGLLGTSANVTAMGLLGVSGVITDMGLLGTSAVVTDLDLLGTSANVTAMGLLGVSGVITDMGILGTSANVTAMSTVADNIAGVNSFADRYRVGSTNPSSSLDEGDLFYNSSDNTLKYYNGTSWASITAGIGSMADDTTPQLGGDLDLNGNSIDFPTTPNISDVLDEDTMSSDSATKLATQQSIKAYVDNAAGKTELYGFKKTNGSGNQLEDLIMTYTNGADNISVANNDGTQSDLYDESIIANQGLTFSVNADGELNVTV